MDKQHYNSISTRNSMKIEKKSLAISQSFLLVLSIVAVAFFIGAQIETVSADFPTIRMTPAGASDYPHSKKVTHDSAQLTEEEQERFDKNMEAGKNFEKGRRTKALYGVFLGSSAGYAAYAWGVKGFKALGMGSGLAASMNFIFGIAAAGITVLFLLNLQTNSREVFSYNPGVWQPIRGGDNCEACNDLKYGCSEYQCKTYGSLCDLVNPDTEDTSCIFNNTIDITPPTITPMEDALISNEYAYVTTDQGAKLTYNGGCLPAFKGVTFGVETNIRAQCRYDISKKMYFEEMAFPTNYPSTSYLWEHEAALSNTDVPSQYAANDMGLTFDNGEDQSIYFMCQSMNKQPTPRLFILTYCVDPTPDLTPTEMISTIPEDGAYITAGVTSTNFSIVTNKPANCSWDFKDIAYEDMNYTMDRCSQNHMDHNIGINKYGCTGTLTGLKDDTQNKYYIKCKDKPSLNESDPNEKEKRIVNQDSFPLTLVGTKGLVLDEITVNGEATGATLKDSTDPIAVEFEVKTSQGAEKNGNVKCSFKSIDSPLTYEFENDGSFEFMSTNTQLEYLSVGQYTYTIGCRDLANNYVSQDISFTVETDTTPPSIARAFKDSNQMKVITTEYADCYFSTEDCTYPVMEGVKLSSSDNFEHTTPWDEDIDKYIKCVDRYGTPPEAAECSIVVRGHAA